MTRDQALQTIQSRFPTLLIDDAEASPPGCIVVRQTEDGYPFCINLPAGGPDDGWQMSESLKAVKTTFEL